MSTQISCFNLLKNVRRCGLGLRILRFPYSTSSVFLTNFLSGYLLLILIKRVVINHTQKTVSLVVLTEHLLRLQTPSAVSVDAHYRQLKLLRKGFFEETYLSVFKRLLIRQYV